MSAFSERKSLFLPTLFAFLAANLSRRASGSKTVRSYSAGIFERSASSLRPRTFLKLSIISLLSFYLIASVLPSNFPLAMLIIVAFE